MTVRIWGARVLLADGGIGHQSVTIDGGMITAIGGDGCAPELAVDGLLLWPGMAP